jgi:hypothetical protein
VSVTTPQARPRVLRLAGSGSGHLARRHVEDGQAASLLNPAHYPVEALCLECGQPVRCERYYLAEWRHIERFTIPRA